MGTAFLVHGEWYLRYVDGGGAMVRIEANLGVKDALREGAMVNLEGYMSKIGPRHQSDDNRLVWSVRTVAFALLGFGKSAFKRR